MLLHVVQTKSKVIRKTCNSIFVYGQQNIHQWFSFSLNRQENGLKESAGKGDESVRSSRAQEGWSKGATPPYQRSSGDEGTTEQKWCPLKDKGQDGRAQGRVIPELLQVAAVLPLGPNSHLNESHQCEEGHRDALSHDGEAEPGAQLREKNVNISRSNNPSVAARWWKECYLVCVVWTGDQQEDPGEGVLGGIGDLSGFRTWVKGHKRKQIAFLKHFVSWLLLVRTVACLHLVGGDSSEQHGWKSCQSDRTKKT